MGKKLMTRLGERYRLRRAVREALDTLPSAVCFFTATGTIKLCNTAMYRLFRTLAQRDLQSLGELEEALAGCGESTGVIRDGSVYLFPDGSAWQYSARQIQTADGTVYTEAVFSEVTRLYEKQRELRQQSEKLKKMYRELKALSENVLEMTREQEILNLKTRLHDQMNMGVAAIRQILRQQTTSEENAAAVLRFRRAIQVLREESADPRGREDVAEFLRDAAVSGVRVELTGQLPEQERPSRLLLRVLREACVNAARHGDATLLSAGLESTAEAVTLCVTNNGRQPEGPVIPRGGLADLDRAIRAAGGSLRLQWQPAFALTVTLPLGKEEQEVPE